MASRNAKTKNSSDSEGETEWTFIDADEGTIETRKDSVTYRKPTYSEILKGVVAEDLVEEVESEPEFEVLASFKFRPKGESFGLGSSAPKSAKNSSQGKESKHEVDDDDDETPNGDDSSCNDDGIMIISSHIDETNQSKPDDDDDDDDKCRGNDSHEVEDTATGHPDGEQSDDDDDDDFVITENAESDFEEATMNNASEADEDDNDDNDDDENNDIESDEDLTESTNSIEDSLNESTLKDSLEQSLNEESQDEDSIAEAIGSGNSDNDFLGVYKGGIFDNTNKDLAWDSLTFQLLSTLPRMSDSATSLGDDNENLTKQSCPTGDDQNSDSENTSNSSYVGINQDDSSSFDELSDLTDANRDILSDPMIPSWFFNAENNDEDTVESLDDDTDDIISDIEELDPEEESRLIPRWFFDSSYKIQDMDGSSDKDFDFLDLDNDDLGIEESKPIIPNRFFDPNDKTEDKDGSIDEDFDYVDLDKDDLCIEEPNPIIPSWFFDPNYKIQELNESLDDWTDYSDFESNSDSDFDDKTSVTLPRWLFDENFKHPEKDEGFSWSSHLFVDIPTFIILLCLTTALGLSIGHGLTVYLKNQSISRNTKLHDLETPTSNQFPGHFEDLGLTAEEVAKIDLIKQEDELYRQKESELFSEHLRYDLKELYKSLQKRHYRLLRNQKSTEGRLHISKTMSWYWRLKYDEEKRQNRKTGLPTNLRPKNFSDMAGLVRKTNLAKKWRRYKKDHTAQGKEKIELIKTNLRWLLKPLDTKLKRKRMNEEKVEQANQFWMKAMALFKGNDMKDFKRRWTQDLKLKSCCSYSNKSAASKRKTLFIAPNPFVWVDASRHCKRANTSDNLGLCLRKRPLGSKKNLIPTNKSPAERKLGKKIQDLKFKPCFVKPRDGKIESVAAKSKTMKSSNKAKSKARKGKRVQSSNGHEKIRREKMKKRELKKKSMEIKDQVKELKHVLAELRRERRRAEKEKARLEASWRKLKRQRLQFEEERIKLKKRNKKKVKRVKSKLKREKTRLKTWKNVAKNAQKEAQALHKQLKRVSLAKQKVEEVKSIKKELKLEKRKLRKQQKTLKSIKQQLRREHRNYARERWKTKKKRREFEKQQRFTRNQSEAVHKKQSQAKKQGKKRNRFKEKPQRRERSSKNGFHDEKRKNKKHNQKRFWKNLEKSLYEWAQKVNSTIQHHRRGKASKIWKTLREQFDKLMNWTTGKSSRSKGPVQKKKQQHPKRKVKAKNRVFEKIFAEQMKFDQEKRIARKKAADSEDQWKSRGPIINKKRKTSKDVRKDERMKKDSDALLRQRQRKKRKKYVRELERLRQWALQMNEKKLEHDRIYRDKEKKILKNFKPRRSRKPYTEKEETNRMDRLTNSRALVSVEESNNTMMLLVQPQISDANYRNAKSNSQVEDTESQAREDIVLRVTKSQINHELRKKKKTDTSLSLPADDDVIKLPDDVNKGVSSFGGDELSSHEPTPPSLGPTFYEDFPIIKIIEDASTERDVAVDVADVLPSKGHESSKEDDNGQRSEPWYMRRAEQRDVFRNTNLGLTLFPRIGPLKADGTWFFHRSGDRALQRKLYEPLNRQSARDGFKHDSRRSYFDRGRRRNTKDGKWVFNRANDRAEQRSSNEPWYMRRAEGRKEDRDESKYSWFIERGFYRDQLHDYDEDDDIDDIMNDYDDYDDQDFQENEDPWF